MVTEVKIANKILILMIGEYDMDAVEFLKKYFNICNSVDCCKNCPINNCLNTDDDYSVCTNFMFKNPEKVVDIISNI